MTTTLDRFAEHLGLGSLLNELQRTVGVAEHVHHWTQGEFHHDLVLRVADVLHALPGSVLVVSTNCNGGVKELLCLDAIPDRAALWHQRCPDNPEFSGALPPILASVRTVHWFDPCNLLRPDARSELRPEFRERQAGGGWQASSCRVQ